MNYCFRIEKALFFNYFHSSALAPPARNLQKLCTLGISPAQKRLVAQCMICIILLYHIIVTFTEKLRRTVTADTGAVQACAWALRYDRIIIL